MTSCLLPQDRPPLPGGLPHVAYVLLWYPLFTQPFIFREVEGLKKHLPITVYSLYGKNLRHCSAEMRLQANGVHAFGIRALPRILAEMARQIFYRPLQFCRLFRQNLFRRWPNLEILGENLWAFCAGLLLARIFREAGIDMIYAPWPRGTATAARIAASLTGLPFAMAARGDNLDPADPDLADKLDAALFVRANNAADKARMKAFIHGIEEKLVLVYNSLSLPAASTVAHAPRERGKPLRLLALGRFDVTKGFDVLLKACAILRRRNVPFILTLAGGGGKGMGLGDLAGELFRLRSQLHLEQQVHMPGLISHNELPQILAKHDIFVAPCVIHPSGRRDGIPNTVIEALSSGIPVVSTTVNALPEIIRHGETGLAVPPSNPLALADAINFLYEHPEEAQRLGAAGAAFAMKMFDPAANSLKLATVFIEQFQRWKASCAA